MRHKKIILCLIVLSSLLVAACSNERHIADLRKFVDDTSKSAAENQKLSAVMQLRFPKAETYTAKNARSPFAEVRVASATTIKLHPLENYSIDSLKFKGTVSQGDNILAFILAPDNKLYQVKTGDPIGDHYGKIVNIYPNHIDVEETTTKGGTGTISKRMVTLQLQGTS